MLCVMLSSRWVTASPSLLTKGTGGYKGGVKGRQRLPSVHLRKCYISQQTDSRDHRLFPKSLPNEQHSSSSPIRPNESRSCCTTKLMSPLAWFLLSPLACHNMHILHTQWSTRQHVRQGKKVCTTQCLQHVHILKGAPIKGMRHPKAKGRPSANTMLHMCAQKMSGRLPRV